MRYFVSLLLSLFVLCGASAVSAQTAAGKSSGPLIVNIDNPNFRKLVAAIPTFMTAPGAGFAVTSQATAAATELGRLLTFSGLFSLMAENGYQELANEMQAKRKIGTNTQGMQGIDAVQWKAIGVESLTVGEMEQDGATYNIALRTVDINRSEIVVGRRFTKVQKHDINRVLRRYADLILQAYTGKPGIFSTKLVFVGRPRPKAHKQIYIANFDGSEATPITSTPAPHLSPAWSPDGRFITYTSFELGSADVFIYEVATRQHRRLSVNRGVDSGANWAPNNQLIALSGSLEGDTDIYTISPRGGTRQILIRGSGLDVDPAFSPDGKYLAFVSGRFGNPHIFRATLQWDGPGKVRVLEDKRLTYAGWYNAVPSWSPASDKIAFAGFDKEINRFDLFMMNPDGTNMERLTLRAGDNESPTWSPNGQLIIFHSNRVPGSEAKNVAQLYIMNRDGSGQRKLETGLHEAQTPSWSPPLE